MTSPMRFSLIYDFVIPLWGDEIDISDWNTNLSSNNLSQKWNEVEKIIGSGNTFTDLMVWTMYQVFHKTSRELFYQNVFKLFPKEIAKNKIQQRYFENLNADGWELELKSYINDLV